MKCQRCTKGATQHITEVLAPKQIEEFHLCEECAQKYLFEPPKVVQKNDGSSDDLEDANVGRPVCSVCGLKFVEFRNSGRLGCPHDYTEFRDDLMPLLENIHGDTRHAGKTPRRQPHAGMSQGELLQLRKQLLQAVTREAYEEAAQLRDRIRQLETS